MVHCFDFFFKLSGSIRTNQKRKVGSFEKKLGLSGLQAIGFKIYLPGKWCLSGQYTTPQQPGSQI